MEFFLKQLCLNLDTFGKNTAFHIEGKSYTYTEFGQRIANIQQQLLLFDNTQYFGVVTRNSIHTFATIFALWLSGKTSVPISAKTPQERNRFILDQVGIDVIFDASESPLTFDGISTIGTSTLTETSQKPVLVDVPHDTDLYLLFTSGSTGLPKGVQISRANLDAYLNAFFQCGYQIDSSDRCIEVFELTFDASVQCYTFPLMKGASVYTLPEEGIKFLSILKIMQEHNITFVKMTPSAIYYLQNYFDQIRLPHLKYCLFGAEAFPVELVKKWELCIPNAEIHNVYGPTEATINCAYYQWKRDEPNKSFSGIATIGKPFSGMEAIVCDENQHELAVGEKGELCVAGPQITKGYWQNPENNKRAFFTREIGNKTIRYYRTGDLAFKDEEGDFLFVGRIDSQVQVDGHRIELGEIENYAGKVTGAKCVAIVPKTDEYISTIVLFVESLDLNEEDVLSFLRKNLPEYMIPKRVVFLAQIPLLSSGKTDRQKLQKLI